MNSNKKNGTAMGRHLAAIESGNVTKTNVIGLRKACNHVAQLRKGWSGGRCAATPDEVGAAMVALERHKPFVRGELHASGIKLLTDRRYKKRLESVADRVAKLHSFSLVGFIEYAACNFAPVYVAFSEAGYFRFYNIPWQAALVYGIEGGPVIVRGVDS